MTTFEKFINNAVAKGATQIEIHRSESICGCVKPNDIIFVRVVNNANIYTMSLIRVFDEKPMCRCEKNGNEIKEIEYRTNL